MTKKEREKNIIYPYIVINEALKVMIYNVWNLGTGTQKQNKNIPGIWDGSGKYKKPFP